MRLTSSQSITRFVRSSSDCSCRMPRPSFASSTQELRKSNQLNSLLGQTPWAMMNQLTERNLEVWKDFQQTLTGGGTRPSGTAREKDKTRG